MLLEACSSHIPSAGFVKSIFFKYFKKEKVNYFLYILIDSKQIDKIRFLTLIYLYVQCTFQKAETERNHYRSDCRGVVCRCFLIHQVALWRASALLIWLNGATCDIKKIISLLSKQYWDVNVQKKKLYKNFILIFQERRWGNLKV